MHTETIVSTLLATAAWLKEPAHAIASQGLRDLYAAAKYYLKRKFAGSRPASAALESAIEKPTSPGRKAVLIEEAEPFDLEADPEILKLTMRLAELLPSHANVAVQNVKVEGNGNQVKVAGRDLIVTERHVQRNTITPDERHLMHDQRSRLLPLMHDLAERLAGKDGEPNLAAVHRMLQRKFEVPSYLLIPRERYAEVLAFLNQRRAMRREAFNRRNPDAVRQDLFRAIFSRATELGWTRHEVYAFARERLELPVAIASLKRLGFCELRALLQQMRRSSAVASVG